MLKPPQLAYVILEVLMALLAVLGNVLVCWAVCLNSNLQTVTNLFVVSLAVADVAVGLLAIPFAIVISTGICAQFFGCLFMACFVLILTQSSIFSLLAIAVDRYVAITNPLRYSSLVTGRRAKFIITLCWLLSFSIGLTPMLGWNNGPNATAPTGSNGCPAGLSECLFEGVVTMDYMIYFNFFGCVLLPLFLMLIIYMHIFLAARRQLLQMGPKVAPAPPPPESSSSSKCSQSTLKKEVHAAKSLAIIVGFFALCWLPLHVINCFNYLCQRCERVHVWLINTAIILSHANSVVNPFIYAYRIREFRQTFRRIAYQHILGRKDGAAVSEPRSGEELAAASRSITWSPSGTSKEGSLCSTVVSSSFLDSVSDRVPAADSCSKWTSAEDAAPSHRIANKRDATRPPRSAAQTCTASLAEPDITEVSPDLQESGEVWEGLRCDLQESGEVWEGPRCDLQESGEVWEGSSNRVTFVNVKLTDCVGSTSLTDVS